MSDYASPTEALAHALALAITAPTEATSEEAVAIANELAAGLSEVDVARAKRMAQELARGQGSEHVLE